MRFFQRRYVTIVRFRWGRTRRSFARPLTLVIRDALYVDYNSHSRDTVLFEGVLGQSIFGFPVDAPFAASSSSHHSHNSRRLHSFAHVGCLAINGIDASTASSHSVVASRRFRSFARVGRLSSLGAPFQAAAAPSSHISRGLRSLPVCVLALLRVASQTATSHPRLHAISHVLAHVGGPCQRRACA